MVLVIEKPVELGDYVVCNAAEGTVIEIGSTHSKIKSPQGLWLVLPNSDLTSNSKFLILFHLIMSVLNQCCFFIVVLVNYNKEPKLRVHIDFTIRHTEDVELIREIFLECCAADERICTVPRPALRITEFRDSGVSVC